MSFRRNLLLSILYMPSKRFLHNDNQSFIILKIGIRIKNEESEFLIH